MTRDYAARRGRGFPNPYDLSLADNVYQVMKKIEQKIPISEKIFPPRFLTVMAPGTRTGVAAAWRGRNTRCGEEAGFNIFVAQFLFLFL